MTPLVAFGMGLMLGLLVTVVAVWLTWRAAWRYVHRVIVGFPLGERRK